MMNSKLKKYAMTLMLGMGVVGTTAITVAHAADDAPLHTVGKSELRSVEHDAGITTFADIGGYSQYIFRGAAQGGGKFSAQGDVGIEHESGVSANVWFATGVSGAAGVGKETEFDFTVDYSGEAGDVGYSVGYIAYKYTDSSLDVNEFYLGASYNIASATVYVADTYKYTELGLGTSVADLFDASLAFGIVSPDVGSSVNQTTIALSKDFDNLSASLTYGKFDTLASEIAVGISAAF